MIHLVSVKRALRRAIPAALLRRVERGRERSNLARLASVEADSSALGACSNDWLQQAMRDEAVSGQYQHAVQRIDELNIVAFAGGVNPGDPTALFHVLATLKPQRVLEIGTHSIDGVHRQRTRCR